MPETSDRMNRKRELLSGILNKKTEENGKKDEQTNSNEFVGSNENIGSNEFVGSNENAAMNSLVAMNSQLSDSNENVGSNEFAAMKTLVATNSLVATKTQLYKPPEQGYSGWFFEAARRGKNLSGTGLLLLLDHIVPPGGCVVRVGALSRSAGIHPNNIRVQLDRLAESGLIESVRHGLDGRWIRISCRDDSNEFAAITKPCSSVVNKTTTLLQEKNTNENVGSNEFIGSNVFAASNEFVATGGIAPTGKFASILKNKKRSSILEGLFAAALSAGKAPEDLQRQIIERLVALAEQKSPQIAMATICEFLPAAKSNPGAYLARVLDAGAEPSPARLADAEKISEALRSFRMEIGVEILPADWCKASRVLGIVAKPEESSRAQKATLSRLDAFVAALLPNCNASSSG